MPHARILSRSEHGISRQSISPGCLKVLYGLIDAGYDAYIVGGGVRDLLLGLQPKDFDIATNATPEQVRSVFRNSRIIGRRFRIVHVHFGKEIIEVSTFRALADATFTSADDEPLSREEAQFDAVRSASGMILRDNVYGSIEEDVQRRDFTVNALYYTVRNFVVHDYVDGLADIDRRCLRMIGDAEQRYREDPVRMLRAIRLAAKLDFSIAATTEEPIRRCAPLLASIPPARLFDEFLKLFLAGHSLSTYRLLQEQRLFAQLFPATAAALQREPGQLQAMLELALANTDARLAEGKSITPVFLLAVLLWPALEAELRRQPAHLPPYQAQQIAAQKVFDDEVGRMAIPKRFSFPVREIWELQLGFLERRGRRAEALLAHKRFRAAIDFLMLREQSGEPLQELRTWWQNFAEADATVRASLLQATPNTPAAPGSKRGKARRRRVKSAQSQVVERSEQ